MTSSRWNTGPWPPVGPGEITTELTVSCGAEDFVIRTLIRLRMKTDLKLPDGGGVNVTGQLAGGWDLAQAAEGLLASGTSAANSNSGPAGRPVRLMPIQRGAMT